MDARAESGQIRCITKRTEVGTESGGVRKGSQTGKYVLLYTYVTLSMPVGPLLGTEPCGWAVSLCSYTVANPHSSCLSTHTMKEILDGKRPRLCFWFSKWLDLDCRVPHASHRDILLLTCSYSSCCHFSSLVPSRMGLPRLGHIKPVIGL